MSCESCNRNKALKAFCYFKNRPSYFKDIYNCEFSIESFTLYAVNYQLSWRLDVCCAEKSRNEFKVYWRLLREPLKKVIKATTK